MMEFCSNSVSTVAKFFRLSEHWTIAPRSRGFAWLLSIYCPDVTAEEGTEWIKGGVASLLEPVQDREWERWGAGVETQKYVRGDIGGWGRVPSNETYAPSLSTIYDGA